MVRLTVTDPAKAAIDRYCSLLRSNSADDDTTATVNKLSTTEVGGPIQHHELIEISRFLTEAEKRSGDGIAKKWCLDTLLKGALVYQPPPPPKKEPTPEFKALMARLRADEERKQYERMTNPPSETFGLRSLDGTSTFEPATSHGQTGVDQIEESTYQDVERQMALIINVLVSIIACSVAIWIAARHWSVPQRLGLSMSGSATVAIAEVAIYLGYIKRTKDAKDLEIKKAERKEVVETWVIDSTPASEKTGSDDSMRYRKGKHR